MKALLFILSLNISWCFGQSNLNYNILTKKDRQNYGLVIKQGPIVPNKCAPKQVTHFVYALFINRSNDTLKYWDYTCSSFIWDMDNNNNFVLTPPSLFQNCYDLCNSNFPRVFIVPPHKNKLLHVFVTKTNSKNKSCYKIGIALFRYKNSGDYIYYEEYLKTKSRAKNEASYVVWSMNTIK